MPIYDYFCGTCRHVTEVIHGIQEAGPRFCPACGADGTMRKALSSPSVHFKGSGWAKKDRSSASASRTKAAASSSSGDASGDHSSAPGSGPSEQTPAATESAKPATEKKASSED